MGLSEGALSVIAQHHEMADGSGFPARLNVDRMAIGARRRDILRQFLIEAITLSLIGGFIGAVLGVGASIAIAQLGDWPTSISIGSIVLAFGFSAAIGVFFGFYPARKAAQLDPIEALRYE
jgi:putative ABC transport system permease protein